jgi:glycosyltransferase involved in cell wall biosynthesis
MDVLAHPSTREGLPRTVTQALLAGVCPVAYDVNGTREVCIPNQTGRLITPGDTAGLGRAILDLYNDPRARQALAHTGQALCRERFGAGRMVDALEVFYTQASLKAETGA